MLGPPLGGIERQKKPSAAKYAAFDATLSHDTFVSAYSTANQNTLLAHDSPEQIFTDLVSPTLSRIPETLLCRTSVG